MEVKALVLIIGIRDFFCVGTHFEICNLPNSGRRGGMKKLLNYSLHYFIYYKTKITRGRLFRDQEIKIKLVQVDVKSFISVINTLQNPSTCTNLILDSQLLDIDEGRLR
jgi:hypothetical protein